MAKSPLIKILRQAYQIARKSRKTGIPSDEVIGILKEQVTRRRVLQGGLGLASAIAASTWRQDGGRVAAQSGIAPVAIVGAGIAGLTAGYRLTQAGVPVNIIEASNRVGGRMFTISKAAGTAIAAELGGEFINSDHTCLRTLAEELDLNPIDILAPQAGLIQETFFFLGRRVSLEEIIQQFAPVAQQIDADLEAIANFESYAIPDPPTAALDRLSIAEYLDRIPSTTPIIRQLIRTAYTIEYGRDAEEQSALNLLYYIGTEPGEFNIFGTSDERFYINGGNEQIPRKLAEILANSIEPGTALEALSIQPDGRYRLSLRSGQSTFDRIYERVLLTVPFSVLRTIPLHVDLPPAKRLAIDTLGYGTNSKLVTGYGEKIWQTRYNSRANVFTDLGFQNTWETSQSRFNPSVGLITNYTGGRQGLAIGSAIADTHAQILNQQLELVFPGINSVALPGSLRSYWPGNVYARGSYTCYLPGQWTQMYGVEGERVGNLFFAGEHTSLEYQGFMEGGCETGESTALQILEDLGLQAQASQQRSRILNNRAARQRPVKRFPFRRLPTKIHKVNG